MISKINFFIAPSLDHKCYVKYAHPNVNVINWTSIWSHFFYWSEKSGKHHWLPSEAIRFLQFASVDEQIDLQLNANTKQITVNVDGKNIPYYVPTIGQYKVTDYNGDTITGDAPILYNPTPYRSEYHKYTYWHRTSNIIRTDYPSGLKILLIGDSMSIPWVLCLAPICSKLTYLDNRAKHNLSTFHLHEYDRCFALMVNNPKVSIQNRFVMDTLTYFANQIKR